MNPVPIIAIVGRPNVGKSCLFNRLVGRRIAIVHDQPGVTRDRLAAVTRQTRVACEVVDTGGIGAALDDGFARQVTTEADIAIQTADIILFVVDCRDHMTPIDQEIAMKLRAAKGNLPIMLVLNKADTAKQDSSFGEFARLGFGSGIAVSAEHGRGISELISEIDRYLPEPPAQEEGEEWPQEEALVEIGEGEEGEESDDDEITVGTNEPIRVAIVGRPNAGKSSLVNAILQDQRTIVSDVAGTTRDAVDIPYTHRDDPYLLIDTAGIRPRARRDSSVEVFSVMRSEKAIRRADICLLVIDIAAGITHQDRRIAGMIADSRKPCIIVANKFDLFHPSAPKKARLEELEDQIRRELFFVGYAPYIAVSALKSQGVEQVFAKIQSIRRSASKVLGTGKLNRILHAAVTLNPPAENRKHGRRLKLYYATAAVNEKYTRIPVPTYILFVNDKRLLGESYEQYLANKLRAEHPNPGVPIVFSPRSRETRDKE